MILTESQPTHLDKVNKEQNAMKAVVMDGEFDGRDALDLISAMYMQKLLFHESKIQHSDSEEDIKQREEKIKSLQQQLHALRSMIKGCRRVQVHAEFEVYIP